MAEAPDGVAAASGLRAGRYQFPTPGASAIGHVVDLVDVRALETEVCPALFDDTARPCRGQEHPGGTGNTTDDEREGNRQPEEKSTHTLTSTRRPARNPEAARGRSLRRARHAPDEPSCPEVGPHAWSAFRRPGRPKPMGGDCRRFSPSVGGLATPGVLVHRPCWGPSVPGPAYRYLSPPRLHSTPWRRATVTRQGHLVRDEAEHDRDSQVGSSQLPS